jgi:lysophospholipase L1-like esterase
MKISLIEKRSIQGPIIALCTLLMCGFTLGICEVLARVFDLPAIIGASFAGNFDMPTWMLKEENTASRAERQTFRPSEIEWLNLFKEGENFRVSMHPNRELMVFDSFNLIPERINPRFFVRSNILGFRSSEPLTKGGTRPIRMVVYGDSSCWGWGVNQKDTFASLIETELKTLWSGEGFEVLNFAIPGDSSMYGRLIFEHFSKLYPAEIAIIGFGANDAKIVGTPHKEQVLKFSSTSFFSKFGRWMRSKSVLFSTIERIIIRSRLSKVQKQSSKKNFAVSRGDFESNITFMAEQSRNSGAKKTIVLSLCSPKNFQVSAQRGARRAKANFFNGQKALLSAIPNLKSGVLHPEVVKNMEVDYPSALQKDPLFYISSDGCHPNQVGHRILADRLLRIINPDRLIKSIRKKKLLDKNPEVNS